MNTFALAILAASTMAIAIPRFGDPKNHTNMQAGLDKHMEDLKAKFDATEYVFDKLEAEDGTLELEAGAKELAKRTEKYPAAKEFYAHIGDILTYAAGDDAVVTTREMSKQWDDEDNVDAFNATSDLARATAENAEAKEAIFTEFHASIDGNSARAKRVADYIFAKLDGEDQVLKKDVAEKELEKWGEKAGLTDLTSYIAGGLKAEYNDDGEMSYDQLKKLLGDIDVKHGFILSDLSEQTIRNDKAKEDIYAAYNAIWVE